MFSDIKIIIHQGKQYIPNLKAAELPDMFRGRPVITEAKVDTDKLVEVCPTYAISAGPVRIDLGKCLFCGECARVFAEKIKFTNDHKISSNYREGLIVKEDYNLPVTLDPSLIRKEIQAVFGRSIKLRHVSAGGDNSTEWELVAAGNVNFDMGRFGIEFVASPRHADGLVITGPITENMAMPLQVCYEAMPGPKVLILAGTDAISGGIFADSPALDRSFINSHSIDLYIPGNPVHPLTFINGLLELIHQ